LHSRAEVREPTELSFGVVSGDGGGMGVLDDGPHAQRERGFRVMELSAIVFNSAFIEQAHASLLWTDFDDLYVI